MLRLLPALFLTYAAQAAMLVTQPDLGLRITTGFKASIHSRNPAECMQLDASGLLVAVPFRDCLIKTGPDGSTYTTDGQAIFRAGKKIADGFLNLNGFDFNSAGDLFAFDADIEPDFFLPWYVPTRLYHVALGQHHGATGRLIKPEYYPDNVEVLTPIGRATPAGVAIYRHTQFPLEYRDGIFLCDEAFGKIYFCKLQKAGSTYRPRLDLFLEGTDLAPRQALVDPQGNLLILTRDFVLKIEHTAERGHTLSVPTKVQEILQAPQPHESWSRIKWVLTAQHIGADAFRRAMNDGSLSDGERARAVEIHVELFGPIPDKALEDAASAKSPALRARAAWALARQLSSENATVMRRLTVDTDATVRRFALESLLITQTNLSASFLPILRQNLDHSDKRLRQVAARICAGLGEEEWERLWDADAAYSVQTELSLLLAATWRNSPPPSEEIFWRALEALQLARDSSKRVQALRLLTLSLGDWSLNQPSLNVFAGYELSKTPAEEFVTNALPMIRKAFQSSDALTETESSRMLAMLQDDSEGTVHKIEKQFEGQTSPTETLHYLIVLAKLRGQWPESLVPKVADFIKTFESRLNERERRPDQNWIERLKETTAALIEREPRLQMLFEKPEN